MIALVDCNNFYVSCERVFAPQYEGMPVAVLSNNDGCIVSRSEEAKRMGIKMGSPVFKYRDLIEKKSLKVFSSNYALYGDMSKRVMRILQRFTDRCEIYSIDEAFLELPGMAKNGAVEFADEIRRTVRRWTGLPVSIGIASTKVLAKVANKTAKKGPGIFCFSGLSDTEKSKTLSLFPVDDLWGIGFRYAKFLRENGIDTALKLRGTDIRWIRKKMTSSAEKLVMELRGVSCLSLETRVRVKKEISCSRSFGVRINNVLELKESIACYASQAAEKLRLQKSLCSGIYVFVMTSRFDKNRYYNGMHKSLRSATADTSTLISQASGIIDQIYSQGKVYTKAGLVLTGIKSTNQVQFDFFDENYRDSRSEKVMEAIDAINSRWQGRPVGYASMGTWRGWEMTRKFLSPKYTTSWGEIPTAKA